MEQFLHDNLVLEDNIALLRPLQETDFNHLLPFALNEQDTWKYSLVGAEGEDGLRNYMNIAMGEKKAGREFPFISFDKRTGEYAGSTRFYDINFPYQTLQLGYTWFGKRFQGTGLNKHCKFLLMQFVFETLQFERLELRADAENERSIAAMKSIGCKVDGILRSNMPRRLEGRRDSIVLSVLRDEWFGTVKEMLSGKL